MNKVLFRPGMSIKEIGEQLQGYIAQIGNKRLTIIAKLF